MEGHILFLVSGVFCGTFLYFIAQKRNVNKYFWFLMGLGFGIFAIPFVFIARPKKSPPHLNKS